MARSSPQPIPTKAKGLKCARRKCPSCGSSVWHAYDNYHQVRTLQGVVQLQLQIHRCPHPECERYHQPYRPKAEGKWVLPQQEFGLNVMALDRSLALPRAPQCNNDLEPVFGQWRHHQRRCTGRKVAPDTAVTQGSVERVAAGATQRRSYSAAELATVNPVDWQ